MKFSLFLILLFFCSVDFTSCTTGRSSSRSPFAEATLKDVRENNVEAMQKKIFAGDIRKEERDMKGNSLLHVASGERSLGMITLLVQSGWNINELNDNGEVALHVAATRGDASVIRFLLDNGARTEVFSNEDRLTPLYLAISNHASTQIVSLFMKAGANPDAKDINGKTPLYFAKSMGLDEQVKIMSAR